jgi:hypothetical protein
VGRGNVLFAHPKFIHNAIEHALKLGKIERPCAPDRAR